MKNIEIYTYTKDDFLNSIQTIKYPKGNTDKICIINNVAAPLYNCENIKVGLFTAINNITQYNDISFTNAIYTIITPYGSLVFNSYVNNTSTGILSNNVTFEGRPTLKSGLYENYKDIVITIITFDDNNTTRILNIAYYIK